MNHEKARECYRALLAQKLIEEFSKRNIEGFYCETKEEALKKVLELTPKGDSVSCGGSATLHEIALHDTLKQDGYDFLDPDDVQGGKAKEEMARRSLGVDTYFMSANAISLAGELVNLDGVGNRVAALSFGPKRVMVIAGLNKVAPTLEAAIQRAKTYAAPHTLLLFKQDYASYDELLGTAETAACSQLVITRMSMSRGRITVLLVGESLGF